MHVTSLKYLVIWHQHVIQTIARRDCESGSSGRERESVGLFNLESATGLLSRAKVEQLGREHEIPE